MIPAIITFKEALESPYDRFRTIRSVVPVRRDGGIAVSRTSFFAESLVRFEGRQWLLCMPLTRSAIIAVERMANQLQYIASRCLCEYRVLYREMVFEDALGRRQECDMVLQEYPEGEVFGRDCSYNSGQLRAMLDELHGEMMRLGFTHNHLTPSNIVIGDDQRMHPVRYHYAEFGDACRDDFAPLYATVQTPTEELHDVYASYSTENSQKFGGGILRYTPHEGLVRIVQGELYGYADEQMRTVIRPQYIWADDFREGRAVVETSRGLGLIDKTGREIIPAEYDDLRYDVYGGESTCFKDGRRFVFGYDGHLIYKQ
ncbi:MAG: WG repeat-containing protein [Alistipes sp.]